MINRPYWKIRIEESWKKAPIVWLTGVRRAGKTTLAKTWEEADYLNCDLPRVRELLKDPELFFQQVNSTTIILDEIHQTDNPSEILKIAADEFPDLRILATGSSTLAATKKFKDSLTGRKRIVHLCPVLASELDLFGVRDFKHRLLFGGLPQKLLSNEIDPEFYSEWLDSYYARDVQELFNVGKRSEFLKLCELILRQSGQMAEITSLSKHSGLSRPTVMNYLQIFETTHFANILRPYHAGGRREILAQPKVYAFDTGFVSHFRGWESLRIEDCGNLLENLAMDELRTIFHTQKLQFWRDKQQREIDFVITGSNGAIHTFECKWSADHFSTRNLDAFRDNYPNGENFVITGGNENGLQRTAGNHLVRFCGIKNLHTILTSKLMACHPKLRTK